MNITRVLISAGLLVFAGTPLKTAAQDYDSLRINTWSVYLQGGMSWAGGVGMKNVDATSGTTVSPLVGLGVNYNIRPWVRLGLNYEFSKFGREQRFSEFQPVASKLHTGTPTEQYGGRAYCNMWTQYHNLDLTADFNIMEIWKNRQDKKLNLYIGTGIGCMFAKGNTYDIAMGYERWSDPDNYDNSLQVGDNHELYTWMTAGNSRHRFNSLYVPVVLSAEYDINPRWTAGVRGGGKFLFSSDDLAPKNVWYAAVVVRYNFGTAKCGFKTNKCKLDEMTASYNALLESYNRDLSECQKSYEAAATTAAAAAAAQEARLKALEARNAQLEQELKKKQQECDKVLESTGFNVQFARKSSRLSTKEKLRLLHYIETAQLRNSDKLVVIGEASAEGSSRYNQKLSERRLAQVLSFLEKNGVSSDRIKMAKAIGSSAQIDDPSARRVMVKITVE